MNNTQIARIHVSPAVTVSPPPSGFPRWPFPWLCPGGPWCISRNLCVTILSPLLNYMAHTLLAMGCRWKQRVSLYPACPCPTLRCIWTMMVLFLLIVWGLGIWICEYIYGMDTVVRGLHPRPYCQSIDPLMIVYLPKSSPPPQNAHELLLIILNQKLIQCYYVNVWKTCLVMHLWIAVLLWQ